jgi:hypothetical protein
MLATPLMLSSFGTENLATPQSQTEYQGHENSYPELLRSFFK